jgi:peptide/nickel transport system substrate-binding protein
VHCRDTGRRLLVDVRVRQALEYAIDKEGMAGGIGKGFMKPAYQGAKDTDLWYITGQTGRKYDPAKVKQLLADAGI